MANSKRRCKNCQAWFTADSMIKTPRGTFCGMAHAIEWGQNQAKAKTEKARKAKHREDKERIKPLSTVCAEAQKDVNAMIRAVDEYHGYRCIATGEPISDCGHFYHAGSKYRISWLRFHHANLHGQGSQSNRFAGGGDALNYAKGLEARYGSRYIDELDDFKLCEDHGLWPKPTKDDVRAMAAWARAMTRIYKRMS